MMSSSDWDQKLLFNELSQGKELVSELSLHLNPTSPNGAVLVQKLLSSYNKVLSMLNCNRAEEEPKVQEIVPVVSMTESPRSVCGSPQSNESEYVNMYKKRKVLPQWSEQVRGSSESGFEGPVEDGYSWRKYGQKDILGSKFPRGYYRCTHRNAHGCLATKQVQRSDKNPTIFDVTYRGKHTCIQASHILSKVQSPKQEQKQKQKQKRQKTAEETLLNFRSGLKVKTENLNTHEISSSSFSFSFPSTSSTECPENNIFTSFGLENQYLGSFSPSFISPATSESNYFSPYFGNGPSFPNSDSAATSSTNSPMIDLDFGLEPIEVDASFFFDNSGFFN